MSKEIDQRVVEMQFNNKDFEKNTATSISTLDKLKKALKLDGAAQGLNEVGNAAKNVDLTPLGAGVETVKVKFSALEVVAITALQNITNQVINTGKQLVNSLTMDQVTAGWTKYEQKTASVQTIMNATGKSIDEVNAYLDKLMWFSDETSYSFTDMTSAIGQMTSSGGDIDKIIPLVMGVANATAYAGKGAAEFSHVMYNLNQAYSAGALKLTDWKSVELMGVGSEQLKQTLIDTAVELGKIKEGMVDVASFSTTLSDAWLDQEVMEQGFGKFATMMEEAYELVEAGKFDTASEAIESLSGKYETYIERATKSAQEAKSFTEAIEATKDAVSSGWMETFEIIFGNYEEAKVLWTELANTLWDVFASGAEGRNDLLREALGTDSSGWGQLTETIEETGIAVEDFQNGLIETAKAHGIAVDEMIEEAGSFEESLKSGWLNAEIFSETLSSFADGAEGYTSSTKSMTDALEEYQTVFDKVWRGDYGNGQARIKALTEAGYDYATVQKLVNEHTAGYKLTLEDLSDVELESIGYTEDQIAAMRALAAEAGTTGSSLEELMENIYKPSGRELLIDTMRNAIQGLIKVMDTVKAAWNDVFPATTASQIYNIIDKIHDLSYGLILSDESAEKLQRTFKGLFSVADLLATGLRTGLGVALEVVNAFLEELDFGILDVTSSIGDSLSNFSKWVKTNETLAKAIEKVTSVLKTGAVTLASWINNVRTWITSNTILNAAMNRLVTALLNAAKAMANWVVQFMKSEQVQKVLTVLLEVAEKLFEKLVEWLADSVTNVAEFIENFKGIESVNDVLNSIINKIGEFVSSFSLLNSISLENFSAIFTGFKENVTDSFWDSQVELKSFSTMFTTFKTNITTEIKNVGDRFTWLKDKTLEFVDLAKEKLPSIVALGFAGILIKSLNSISSALTVLATPINNITAAFKNMTTAFTKIGKAVTFKQQAQGILYIAVAIGILAGSLFALASVDQSKLWSAVGALTVMTAVMGGLAIAIGLLSKKNLFTGVDSTSITIVALAGSLLMMALALKVMEDMDLKTTVANATVLILAAVGLGIAVGMMSKLAPELSKNSLTLLAMAVSLKILVSALADINSMGLDNIAQSLLVLLSIAGILSLLAIASSGVSLGSGIGLLGIVISLKLFIKVLQDIAEIDMDAIKNNLDAFKLVIGAFAAILVATSLAGANAAKAGIGMLAISVALLIIIKAVKLLAGMSPAEIQAGTDAVSQLLIMMGIVVALSKFSGANAAKAGAMLIEMSVAMLIVAGVIYLLSAIDESDLNKALGAVMALGVLFGGLIAVTAIAKYAKDAKGTLYAMTVAIAAMAAVVLLFAAIEGEALAKAITALGAIVVMIGLLMLSFKALEKVQTGKAIVAIAGLLLVVAGISFIIYELCQNGSNLDNAVYAASGIAILLLSISAACLILSKANTNIYSALPAVIILTGLAYILGKMIAELAGITPDNALQTVVTLSVLLLALAGVTAILAAVGSTGTAGIVGAGVFVAVVAILGTFMGAIGALTTYFPALENFLDKGITILNKIASGLGQFFGNIISGFLSGAVSSLPEVSQTLSDFMTNIQPFIEGAKEIDADAMDGVLTVIDIFKKMAEMNIVSSISSIFGDNSVEDFTKGLEDIGNAIKAYSQSVSEEGAIDMDAIQYSVDAANLLVELAYGLPKSGLIEYITGCQDLSLFGTQMTDFGNALIEYSAAVSAEGAIDQEAVQASVDTAAILVGLAATVPQSGLIPWIMGEQSLSTFGNQIMGFGEGIASYCESISSTEFDQDKVQASVDAATALCGLAEFVPKSGLIPWITGEQDLGDFGENITDLGVGIRSYCEEISNANIDQEKIDSSVAAATSIAALADALPDSKLFDSKMNLGEFGTKIEKFGMAYSDFYENIKNVDSEAALTMVSTMNEIVNLMKNITGVDSESVDGFLSSLLNLGSISAGGIVEAFADSSVQIGTAVNTMLDDGLLAINSKAEEFKTAGYTLVFALGGAFTENSMLLSTTISTSLSTALVSIGSNVATFQLAGTNLMVQFAAGVTIGTVNVTTAIILMLTTSVNTINAYLITFNTTAMMLMVQFAAGITNGQPGVIAAITVLMSTGVNTMNTFYQSFYDSAIYLVEGIVEGLQSQEQAVYNAAYELGQKAVQGERDGQDSHSPSVPMIQSGMWMGDGLIIGLRRMGNAVYDAGYTMGEESLDGVAEAIQSINTAFDENLDFSPTITPVVDMDGVTESAEEINSIFGASKAYNLAGSINRAANIYRSMEEIQNGNSDSENGTGSGNFSFVQNNYSPKALSRIDIYRNTRNQFAMVKDAVMKR